MRRIIISIATIAATAAAASAVTPMWMRDAAISPDGKTIAFTYMGDIYTVPTSGGMAARITSQPTMETTPRWSPDGTMIAYADNRNGNYDIYVVPVAGGTPRRLTTNSQSEYPEAFSPDGRWVYFSAAIQDPAVSAAFPSKRLTELYRVPVDGGGATQIIASPAELISFLPDGKSFVYQDQKGMENEWRKHHTSSVTRDLWLYDANSGSHRNLTMRGGEDRNPIVSPDGSTVTFLSERNGGSFNVWSFPLSNPASVTPLTDFKNHPVRFLSGANDGTLAFTYDGELYTMTPGGAPSKVAVEIVRDDSQLPEIISVGKPASEASVSPDGKQIALVSRGDIFVTSVEYPSLKQVTNTPAAEMHVAWHPKNRSIVYTSERDGHWNIYKASIKRKDDPNFSNATVIDEVALFPASDGVERTYPMYSPDGDKLAFIQDRVKLMVMDLNTGAVRQLTDGSEWPDLSGGFPYTWSPDSRYIALEVVDRKHAPYTDIAIVNVADGKMTNLTGTGYFDASPRWVLDGNAIIFRSDRLGMRNHASWGSLEDVFMVFMNRDAYDRYRLSEEDYALLKDAEKKQKKDKDDKKDSAADKKSKKSNKSKKDTKNDKADEEKASDEIVVELDGITDRLVRLTPNSSDLSDAIITADGETLYYLSAFDKGYDLWKKDLRKGDVSMVKKLGARATGFDTDAEGKNIFLISSQSMQKLDPKSDKLTSISLSGRQKIDPVAEREAMFNNVVFQEREMFYEPGMHGVDWDALTEHYRRFLPHINNGHDFAEMLSEMLGELNVSHTGSGYRGSPQSINSTASLGLLYDMSYDGNGLRVDEVVVGGPFDRAASSLKKGDIIEKINGEAIDADADYAMLFNDIAGKKTLVSIYDPRTGKRWDEVVLPISESSMSELLYHRWVKQREADVDRLSGGRLGYVHIRSMADPSFRTTYADVLGRFNDRDGIVIDIRWNGGGRMHEDIEVMFSGEKYLTQVVRGKETCDMPSRRWNKPSVMLVCEACYSNAHGTPWVYRFKDMGKIVGTPVPGTMTSVNWNNLQNPSFYFGIPVTGYLTAEGNYLENTQLEPDVLVVNNPATLAAGTDSQLEAAVRTLLDQIDSKK